MTVQELIQAALTKAGRLGMARGEGVSVSTAALGFLNRLVANWNLQRCYVAGLDTVPIAITSGVRSYTLGSRPSHIERAEYVTTAGGLSYPVPLQICGVEQFRAIPSQGDVTINVKGLWCDYGVPTAKVYLAPTPAAGSLNLFTWTIISQFGALTDTVSLPAGIERALIDGLAVELAPGLGLPLTPGLIATAAESKGAMEKLNLWHAADAARAAYPDGGNAA